MSAPDVPLELWRPVLRMATELHARRPWRIHQGQTFLGVKPASGPELWLHLFERPRPTLTILQGASGLGRYLALVAPGEDDDPISVLEVPRLELSWVADNRLEPADLELRRALGIVPAVGESWPLLRSWRPGHLPWFLDRDECATMATALACAVELVKRGDAHDAETDRETEAVPRGSRVPVFAHDPNSGDWREDEQLLEPPERGLLVGDWSRETDRAWQDLPTDRELLDVDVVLLPAAVREGSRPRIPYLLLAIDPDQDRVLAQELLHVESTLDAMLASIPHALVRCLQGHRGRPRKIRVRRQRSWALLQPLARQAGCAIELHDSLESLERVEQALLQALRAPRSDADSADER